MKRLRTAFFLMFGLILLPGAQTAFADLPNGTKYGLEWINDWSNSSCSELDLTRLYYRDDVINQFASVLQDANGTQAFLYSQSNVHADHAIEDYNFSGYDYVFADNVQIYAFAGHGGVYNMTIGNLPQQKYMAAYYASGNSNYSQQVITSSDYDCVSESHQCVFGESSSISNFGTHSGSLRWLIYSTCHSVDTAPAQQWITAQQYGVDMILGYRGEATDGETTDENLADFGTDVFEGTFAFKQAWFDANEDWWIDDYPSLVTCDSVNTNQTAQYRLNNYNRTWTKRQHDGSTMNCYSAYTQG